MDEKKNTHYNSGSSDANQLLRSLRESKREKDILLSLSNEISSIRNKMELLPILRSKFRKHSFYTDLAISLINEDGISTSGYLINWVKRRHQHPGYAKESIAKHLLADGIHDKALAEKFPVAVNLEEIIRRDKVPSYIQFLYDRGIRDMIAVALHDRNRPIGFLYLLSRQKKIFTSGQLSLLKGISQQLGSVIANIRAHEIIQQEEQEKEFLLNFSNDIARIKNNGDLLKLINTRLKNSFNFDCSSICVEDREKDAMNVFLLGNESGTDSNGQMNTAYRERTYPRDKLFQDLLQTEYPVIMDIDKEAFFQEASSYIMTLHSLSFKEMIATALRNEHGSFGMLNLISREKNQLNQNQLKILQAIANQVSIALANIIGNGIIQKREEEKSMLLSLSKKITSCRNIKDVHEIVVNKLAPYFLNNELMICLNNEDNLTHSCVVGSVTDETKNHPDFSRGATMKYFINDGVFNVIEEAVGPVIFDMQELKSRINRPFYVDFWNELNVAEIIGFPVRVNNKCIGGVTLYPRVKNSFTTRQLELLQAICSFVGIALFNISSFEKIQSQLEEIHRFKFRLEQENTYLKEQIKTASHYDAVIGFDNGLRNVFQLVSNVASSDSTVLITGETGTGKELIAKAIHECSPRHAKLMVKVNCAALPAQLVESELFGHERGSFTGATDTRIGKFELANNGTLFLDEIGEMPLELQVKLLRALQEKEIERIGGRGVIKTNVRIIAATNRDLYKEVEAGHFRADLFYRLNVFPVRLPPLRERKEDIPVLVSHFIEKFSVKSAGKVNNISPKVIKEMMMYDWPGNVRELEHVIERSLLMTTGNTINEIFLPLHESSSSEGTGSHLIKTLEQNERDHILNALKQSKGRVRGPGGAAQLLAIPPTTLHSKMKKHGIKKTVA